MLYGFKKKNRRRQKSTRDSGLHRWRCRAQVETAQNSKGVAALAPQRQPVQLQKVDFSGPIRTRIDLMFTNNCQNYKYPILHNKGHQKNQKTKSLRSLTLDEKTLKIGGIQAFVAFEFYLFSTFLHDFLYFLL